MMCIAYIHFFPSCVDIILQWDHYISVGPWIATAHEMGHNFGMDHDEGWYCCGLR